MRKNGIQGHRDLAVFAVVRKKLAPLQKKLSSHYTLSGVRSKKKPFDFETHHRRAFITAIYLLQNIFAIFSSLQFNQPIINHNTCDQGFNQHLPIYHMRIRPATFPLFCFQVLLPLFFLFDTCSHILCLKLFITLHMHAFRVYIWPLVFDISTRYCTWYTSLEQLSERRSAILPRQREIRCRSD